MTKPKKSTAELPEELKLIEMNEQSEVYAHEDIEQYLFRPLPVSLAAPSGA